LRLEYYLEKLDQNIEIAKAAIAKRSNVDPKYLKYIGMADYKKLGKAYNFNITDPKHKEYKSTKQELFK
jgi:hypothetical protein